MLSHLNDSKKTQLFILKRNLQSNCFSLSIDDLASFLHSCAQALPQRLEDKERSGFIVVKENIAIEDEDVFDDNDSSVTR